MATDSVSVRTLDGLHLAGTLERPQEPATRAVLLVHGGGVTREEGGFFGRLATGLAEAGVASLRFDLRAHGQSEGKQEELTLSMILNDIRVMLAYLRKATGAEDVTLLGASFGGGLCAYYAAKQPDEVTRLVLFNPQLNYKKRTIDSRAYWENDSISDEAAAELNERGALQFTPTLRHGRPMLNEVFWLRPHEVLGEVQAPTLIVHGTADTLVPFESSQDAVPRFTTPVQLVPVEGSQHGFAVHDDPQYLNPKSQEYQAFVIRTVTDWLTATQ
ncbi:alpha/beta hydrolase [Streptomyces griseorubiginosus]|uniref:alpha/beta hydrolase n=1 Tax=Streptomyces griseorubiginosus TaxID=67304 RepID=UPI002E819366|nr:alpha/beta fold hydrolase [Streptomyces griseorubiginosus]WUB46448.1 alpha/beta fold hydrolase [Streptomyces griseorubiginosus]WUB54969.1 alpha/beta fold hydrolase [Streptomyces griseorubiginosus]